ncbi:MAG: hypothetical protein IJ736_08650 [Firmicutes bacterium]|nr:hypothetical protein [Bacillota bacterium]
MKNDIKNAVKIGCIFVGNVLGAGFASGKELAEFFCRYGKGGIIGFAVCSVLFGILCCKVLRICREKNIKNYNEFNYFLFGEKIGVVTEVFSMLLTAEIFAAMIAGGSAAIGYFSGEESFLWNIAIGGMIFAVLMFDLKGIADINMLLCPILIIGGVTTGLYLYGKIGNGAALGEDIIKEKAWYEWLISAIIYVSYNGVTVIPVITGIGEIKRSARCERLCGIISCLIIFMIGIIMMMPLYKMYGNIAGMPLPLLEMSEREGNVIRYVYFFVFTASVFTTAVGNGFGIVEWLGEKVMIKKVYIKIIVCAAVIIMSKVGFSAMVERIYPLFGCVGVCEIAAVFINSKKFEKVVDKGHHLW